VHLVCPVKSPLGNLDNEGCVREGEVLKVGGILLSDVSIDLQV
jgi:hypothetical protein